MTLVTPPSGPDFDVTDYEALSYYRREPGYVVHDGSSGPLSPAPVVPAWAASTSYSAGQVVQHPSQADLYLRRVTAGVSRGSFDATESALWKVSGSATYQPSFVAVTVQDGSADDTTAIQSALNAANTAGGGIVTVPFVAGSAGTPKLTAPLIVYSNTELRVHPGVDLRLANGTNDNVLVNSAVNTVRRVLDAVTTATSTTMTSATAAFTSGDTGKSITIQGAGAAGVPLTTTITYVNATTVTLGVAASTTVSGQYAAIGTRDRNIKVIGGKWNRQANTNPVSGDQTKCHILRFRHVDGLHVEPDDLLSSAVGSKYGVSIADCTDFHVPRAHSSTHYSDVVHISGPCSQFTIGDITADSIGDDLISFTARDSTTVITDTAGDIKNFTIKSGIKKADLGGGLTGGCLKIVAGKTSDNSASYNVTGWKAGTFIGPNSTQALVYIGDTSGGNIADFAIDYVKSLGGSGGTFDAAYFGGGVPDNGRIKRVVSATDDRGPVRISTSVTAGGRLDFDEVTLPVGHTVTSMGLVQIDGVLSEVHVNRGSHKGGSGGSIIGLTNGLTPKPGLTKAVITEPRLDVATGGSGASLVRSEDSGATLGTVIIDNAVVANANYPLFFVNQTTTVIASNVECAGASLSTLGRVGSAGVVTLVEPRGIKIAAAFDSFTVDAGGTLNRVARNSSSASLDPDFLTAGEEVIDRRLVSNTGLGGTSGRLWLTYFTARKTESITQVRTLQGSQAAATVTLCRIGIYSVAANGDITLVASSTNDATLWTGTFSATTKALSSTWSKVAGQRYAIGLLSVATTAPKWVGVAPVLGTEAGQAPRIAGNVDSQSDLPASVVAGSIANSAGTMLYAALVP